MEQTTTPTKLPTTKQATLFKNEQKGQDEADALQAHTTKVELLIGRKNHQRLRVCGFEVVAKNADGQALPLTTNDERSL